MGQGMAPQQRAERVFAHGLAHAESQDQSLHHRTTEYRRSIVDYRWVAGDRAGRRWRGQWKCSRQRNRSRSRGGKRPGQGRKRRGAQCLKRRSLSSSHSFAIAFQPPHLISCTALPFSQVRFLVETSIGPTLYTRRPRSRPQTLASGNSERRTRERRQRWSQSKGRGTTGLKTGSSMAMAMFVQYNWAEPLIHDFDSCSYIQHHRLFSLQFLYWLVISVSINHHDVYVIYTDCIPGERGRV